MLKRLKDFHVLYAEDDEGVRRYFSRLLKRYFGKVYEACDGKEALEIYYDKAPSVLFVDLEMPRMDGLALVETVRRSDVHTPIVMLTAYADTKRLLKFAELHLTKYLVKPVEPEEFVETIEKIAQNLWKFTSEVALGKNYVWHKEVQALYRNGVEVVLTSTERHIFALLAEHFGSCVTYEEFVYTLWDEDADYEKSLQTLKHHIANIRKKLPELSIRNSYAEGYVLSSV